MMSLLSCPAKVENRHKNTCSSTIPIPPRMILCRRQQQQKKQYRNRRLPLLFVVAAAAAASSYSRCHAFAPAVSISTSTVLITPQHYKSRRKAQWFTTTTTTTTTTTFFLDTTSTTTTTSSGGSGGSGGMVLSNNSHHTKQPQWIPMELVELASEDLQLTQEQFIQYYVDVEAYTSCDDEGDDFHECDIFQQYLGPTKWVHLTPDAMINDVHLDIWKDVWSHPHMAIEMADKVSKECLRYVHVKTNTIWCALNSSFTYICSNLLINSLVFCLCVCECEILHSDIAMNSCSNHEYNRRHRLMNVPPTTTTITHPLFVSRSSLPPLALMDSRRRFGRQPNPC